jgi:hypothetical protein
LLIITGIQAACEKDIIIPTGQTTPHDTWLVDTENLLYMGSEKDRIQSIDTPVFVPIQNIHLNDKDLVFSIHMDGITKVYPHSVMGMHEIVNDQIGNYYYAVTYCPLTGSGIAWNRTINGKVTEFGVSGMLFKDNLIPYDRDTFSNWSQMKGVCINGELIGYEAEALPLVTSTFGMIKKAYPDAMILDHEACDEGICENVRSERDFGEPGDAIDLPPDKRYFGIIDDPKLLVFDIEFFNDTVQIYQANFNSHKLLIVGDKNEQYFSAFIYDEDLGANAFYAVQNNLPNIMNDDTGNIFDMFGNVVSGPAAGKRLLSPHAYRAHTFAWQAIFSEIYIYE